MRSKWYIEFPLVILGIIFAMVFALNIDLSSCKRKPIIAKNNTQQAINAGPISPEQQKWQDGKDLFKANCSPCHNPKANGIGPALKGVTARWNAAGSYKGKTGEQWLTAWVHDWNGVVKEGYKYAVDMANSRPAQMNYFPYLSDEQVQQILFYVESPDGLQQTTAKR